MSDLPSDGDFPDWDLLAGGDERVPAGIELVPAAGLRSLRGRRAVVGLPGLGWRGDLRIDDAIVQASRTYVPALPEQEWYRAEAEQTEVFAPLVPLERVWVEQLSSSVTPPSAADLALVSLDAPPPRAPRRVREVPRVTGLRVIRIPGPDDKVGKDQRDLRAVTEAYNGVEGDICVRVCREVDWYRWAWSGQAPKTMEIPVHLLWVE
ncbi:hypothetical protein [Dactylosporangium sp. CS-033363]|uniref:hypothetical protein n=1 Tax=Dactylosporangium sp. CS-033363 TaxID=3239935 RepID=UPI003D911E59